MKDLVDLKRIWQWCTTRWAQSLGSLLFALVAFVAGGMIAEKSITDDCKFLGAFRDGPQAYNCNPRVR